MEIEQVRKDIENWITSFVEVAHPALGGWPPCPYARRARLDRSYEVRLGIELYTDLQQLGQVGMQGKEVIIYVYDPIEWSYEKFHHDLEAVNHDFLLPKDIIALEDHPNDKEIVNGVCMNQGQYAMAMCQSLSDLNTKAKKMADKEFYHAWPEEYLQTLFHNREDPRK